jgi:hypothetical protein
MLIISQTEPPPKLTEQAVRGAGRLCRDGQRLRAQADVSVHVYGVAFDQFGDGVNEIYAA